VQAPFRVHLNVGDGSAESENRRDARQHTFINEHGIPMLIGLFAVAAITATMMKFSQYFVSEHLIFVYLMPITAIAMYFSSTPAVITMIVSVTATSYFLFPPVFSFRIDDRLQAVELLMFAMFAFIASKACSRLSR
jgi:K+-sensing histidine kinase KdpD